MVRPGHLRQERDTRSNLEPEQEGERAPPRRNEWKNMSMEHKAGVSE